MTALTDIESALSSRSASDAIQAVLEKEYPDVNEVAELGLALTHQSTVLPRHLETLCSREVEGVCKSSELVHQNKAKGATAFKQCRYLEAACAYSESLRHISTGTNQADKLATTLLANRALCLLKAQPQGQCFFCSSVSQLVQCFRSPAQLLVLPSAEAERALVDCEQALQLDSSNAKARYRHIQSLAALGRHADAHQSMQESLEQTSFAAKDREEISQLSDRLQLAERSSYTPTTECQGVAVGARDSAPAVVSPALRLRTSQAEGRHYVAAEDIPPGQLLIMEAPYAAVLTSLHSKTVGRIDAGAVCKHDCIGFMLRHYITHDGHWMAHEGTSHLQLRGSLCRQYCWGCLEEVQPYATVSCPGCSAGLFCNPTCQAANDLHQPGSPLCGRPWPLLLPTDGVLAACMAAKAQVQGFLDPYHCLLESVHDFVNYKISPCRRLPMELLRLEGWRRTSHTWKSTIYAL